MDAIGGAAAGATAGSVVPGLGTAIGAGVGALAGGIGSIISGSKNLKGIRETNEANKAMAKSQMKFQERMSNTAHQRQTKDMIAAGLNPILSATGGSGASAPAGATATMQAPDYSFIGDSLKGGINSGMALMSTMSSLKAQDSQTAKTLAETLNVLEQKKAIGAGIRGQELANAKAEGINPSEIERAKYEKDRSHTAKQREEAEMRYRKLRSKEDEKNVWLDKKEEQIGGWLENLNSGAELFRKFIPFTSPSPKRRSPRGFDPQYPAGGRLP